MASTSYITIEITGAKANRKTTGMRKGVTSKVPGIYNTASSNPKSAKNWAHIINPYSSGDTERSIPYSAPT